MTNERLRSALIVAHIDVNTISKVADVDPKTVQRWLNGRVPHARHRWKIAELLGEREDFLWPINGMTATTTACTSEIIAAYAHRGDVSTELWWQLFLQARKAIDLLGYAMLFIPEQHPRLISLLQEKAAQSCKIRIALADPTCLFVRQRDEEEQLGGTLPARIQTTLHHFKTIREREGVEIRFHSTVLYNSVFRCDDEMFVTPHLYGLHGSKAPLLHLRKLSADGIFVDFVGHFESIWKTTKRVE